MVGLPGSFEAIAGLRQLTPEPSLNRVPRARVLSSVRHRRRADLASC
jgi:hypothetical protein